MQWTYGSSASSMCMYHMVHNRSVCVYTFEPTPEPEQLDKFTILSCTCSQCCPPGQQAGYVFTMCGYVFRALSVANYIHIQYTYVVLLEWLSNWISRPLSETGSLVDHCIPMYYPRVYYIILYIVAQDGDISLRDYLHMYNVALALLVGTCCGHLWPAVGERERASYVSQIGQSVMISAVEGCPVIVSMWVDGWVVVPVTAEAPGVSCPCL